MRKNTTTLAGVGIIAFIFIILVFVVQAGVITPTPTITSAQAELEELLIQQEQEIVSDVEAELLAQEITNLLSVLDDPITIPDSDQNAIDQFLDEEEPLGISASPKIGIAVDVVLIDSNLKIVEVPTNFLTFPTETTPLTLIDEQGRILDLGSITFGFNLVSDQDLVHDISGKFEIIFNADEEKGRKGDIRQTGKILASQEFFGRGIPDEDGKLKLQSTGGKDAVTFIFEDEPLRQFIPSSGSLDNKYQVFITEVSAVVGEGFDTKEYNFSGSFPAYTLRLQFEQDKTVIRDNTGKAFSVFISDSTITECGQNGGNINNFIGRTDIGFPATVQSVEIFDDPNGLPIVTSDTPTKFTNSRGRNQPFGQACGETIPTEIPRIVGDKFSGIPRDSELVFKVNGEEFNITTKKSQQNFFVKCQTNFIRDSITVDGKKGSAWQLLPQLCESNFGFGCEDINKSKIRQTGESNRDRNILFAMACGVKR